MTDRLCDVCGVREGIHDYSDPEDEEEMWICEVDYPYGRLMNERNTDYDFQALAAIGRGFS